MKIEVITHSGEADILEVDNYTPSELVAEINDHANGHMISLSDHLYSKIDIKTVRPYVEETE